MSVHDVYRHPPALPLLDPPSNFLAWSVLNLIFCCWPFAVVALVKSAHSRAASLVGSAQVAEVQSKESLYWNVASLICGLVIWGVLIYMMNVEYRDMYFNHSFGFLSVPRKENDYNM